MKTRALILAAGKSRRMKSGRNKVLHDLLGKTIIERVVDALSIKEIERIGIIVGEHNIEEIQKVLKDRVDYIIQKEQMGTGHAVLCSRDWMKDFDGKVIVVVGDAPLLDQQTIKNLIRIFDKHHYAVVFLSALFKSPPAYGRVIRNKNKQVVKVIEERDASEKEKEVKEVSSSHYCFDKTKLFAALKKVQNDNVQSEYYLPDVIEIFINNGDPIEAITVSNPMLTFGINSQADLLQAVHFLEKKSKL
jgi:bifunctional UDP-N-acetylglucosamine pyrophosphorylase/glucosamine-1-phosphate N-acetyltransferase